MARDGNYNGVTPITRKLLAALGASRRPRRTVSLLPARGGRDGDLPRRGRRPPRRRRLPPRGSSPRTRLHNDGLPRVALKMATGTGKTVVMAMLIAWQTHQQGA